MKLEFSLFLTAIMILSNVLGAAIPVADSLELPKQVVGHSGHNVPMHTIGVYFANNPIDAVRNARYLIDIHETYAPILILDTSNTKSKFKFTLKYVCHSLTHDSHFFDCSPVTTFPFREFPTKTYNAVAIYGANSEVAIKVGDQWYSFKERSHDNKFPGTPIDLDQDYVENLQAIRKVVFVDSDHQGIIPDALHIKIQ